MTKFIELTQAFSPINLTPENPPKILINLSEIQVIEELEGGSKIHLAEGNMKFIGVAESVEQIKKMIFLPLL